MRRSNNPAAPWARVEPFSIHDWVMSQVMEACVTYVTILPLDEALLAYIYTYIYMYVRIGYAKFLNHGKACTFLELYISLWNLTDH